MKMRLQGVGLVDGTAAKNIKIGDILMWNFGATTVVKNVIPSKTGKTVVIVEYSNSGKKDYTRKLGSERLVCIKIAND